MQRSNKKIIKALGISLIVTTAVLLANTASAANTGNKSPSSTGDDFNQFQNPTNMFASDNNDAVENRDGERQDLYGFDFGISSGQIEGIEVAVEVEDTTDATGNGFRVELSGDGGSTYTSSGKSVNDVNVKGMGDDIFILGGPSDTWGKSWSATDLSNSNFRVRLEKSGADFNDLDFDHVQAAVYYSSNQNPNYRNLNDNVSDFVRSDETVNISAEFNDPEGKLDKAYLATNESGSFENQTGRYGSPINFTNQFSNLTSSRDDWNEGRFNLTSSDRDENSGDLGIGYHNGSERNTGLESGLRGFWRKDRDSGGSMLDYSGNNNDGSTTNFEGDERGAKGIFNTSAVDFDGTDDFVSVSQDSSIAVEGDMAVSTWVNFDTTGTYKGAVSKLVYDGGNYNGWALVHTDTNDFTFWTASSGSIVGSTSDSSYTDTNNWHHIVGVRRGGTSYLYVDGVEQTDTNTQAIGDSGSPLTIGRQYQDDVVSRFWDGKIDETRLYDRALTPSEVEDLYFQGIDGTFKGNYESKWYNNTKETVWQDLEINASVPSDTNVSARVEAYDSSDSLVDEQVIPVQDGLNNYSLNLDNTVKAKVKFNGTSSNVTKTWEVNDYELHQEELGVGGWNLADFLWNNLEFTGELGYEIWGVDLAGNWNVTDRGSFEVKPYAVNIIEPPNNGIVDEDTPLEVKSGETIKEWRYNIDSGSNTTFTPNTTITGLSEGDHTLTVWANISGGPWAKEVHNITTDLTSPRWRNQGQSNSSIEQEESIELRAQGRDETNLSEAILATNETGVWQNFTSKYNSPKSLGTNETWTWSNFTWSNSDVKGTIGWRIYYKDSADNYNSTDIKTFNVVGAPEVSLEQPQAGDRTANPVNFTFSADCFSTGGCQEAELYLNLTQEFLRNQSQSLVDLIDGDFNGASASRNDNSGNLGIGYRNGTDEENLVGFWRFDRTSSGVSDYSGLANDGTVNNFEGDEKGIPGVFSTSSYEFDGTDDYVSVPDDPSIEMSDTNQVTVSAWVYPTEDLSGDGFSALVQKSDSSYNLQLNAGQPSFTIYDGTYNTAADGSALPTNEWSHLVGTFDGENITLYVDGIEAASATATGISDASGFDLGIGENLDVTGRHFPGRIDEVRLYNSSITSEKAESLYFNGAFGSFEANYSKRGITIPDEERPSKIKVDSSNIDPSGNISWVEVETSEGGSDAVKLDAGDNNKNYTLDIPEKGGTVDIFFNFTSESETLTPIINGFELYTKKNRTVYNSTTNIQSGQENSILFDFTQNFTLPQTQLWNIEIIQSDGQSTFGSSREVETVEDDGPPRWRNQGQENNSIPKTGQNELYAQGIDNVTLSNAILSTNETGEWENKTGNYDSPKKLDTYEEWTWSNFTWQNNSIAGETIAWRIWYNDTTGKYNSTDIETFSVSDEDLVPPDITILNPKNQSYPEENIDLNVTANEEIDTWTYNLDSSGNNTFTPSTTLSSLSNGVHKVKVYANDTSGNQGSKQRYFEIDKDEPRWRNLQDNTSGVEKSGPINISVEVRDDISGLKQAKLAIDAGEGWTNYTSDHESPETFSGETGKWLKADFLWEDKSEDGNIDYRVWVKDEAGNWNVTDAQSFTLDRIIAYKDIDTKEEWLEGSFNMTSSGRQANSGNLGLGYLNGTTDQPWSPERNLIGSWRLDSDVSGSGGLVKDYSGNGLDGVTRNGVTTRDSGVFSTNSFYFSNTSGQQVIVEQTEQLEPTEQLTVSTWVKRDGAQGDYAKVLWYGDNADPYGPYGFEVPAGGNSNLTFHLALEGSGSTNVISPGVIQDGEWHHVVGTYDGSNQSLYVDGNLVANQSASGSITDYDNTNGLGIGDKYEGGQPFSGNVDEVQIYDTGLSTEEVRNLYFSQKQEFYGEYNTTFDLGNNQIPENITVDYRNMDSTENTSWFNVTTTNGEKIEFQVDSGSGNMNQDLGFNEVGGNITIDINISAVDETLTPIIDGFTLYTDRESPPEPGNPAPEDQVEAGMTQNITLNVSDLENNVDSVLLNLTDASGNNVALDGEMKKSPDGGNEYFYEFSTIQDSSDIGTWNAEVWANDTTGLTGQNSSTFEVQTPDPPEWRNQQQSNDTIKPSGSNNLSAQGFDEVNLRYATLATNETGNWENKTENYSSPKLLNTEEAWTWSNFTWSNESVSGETIAWKIWYNDTAGNYNSTATKTFKVEEGSGKVNGTVKLPSQTTVAVNKTFEVNATVECTEADCGTVTSTLRYNSTGDAADTAISESSGQPFHTTNSNPQTCTLTQGQTCEPSWNTNATGETDQDYNIDVLMEGTTASTNDTTDKKVTIDYVLIMDYDYSNIDFPQGEPGQVVSAPGNSDESYTATLNQSSNKADDGIWMKLTNLTRASGDGSTNEQIPPRYTSWSYAGTCSYSGSNNMTNEYNQIKAKLDPGESITQCFWHDTPYSKYYGQYTGTLSLKVNATN